MHGPDNAAGWDVLADAYQREVGWPDDELTWGLRCPTEAEVGLVTDVVAGARTVVLGCGGGQDLVALAALGAGPLTGVDPSAGQLTHARERLDAAGLEATLVESGAEDLGALDDATADLVVSVQALNYVADMASCAGEIQRVLVPGGVLALSVMHPADVSTGDEPPYAWTHSWFQTERDWVWDGLADEDVPLRSWFPSVSDWFTVLTAAGLAVDRLLEPPPADDRRWIDRGWFDEDSYRKLDLVPATILVRGHRPAR